MTISLALDKDGPMLADLNKSMISMMPNLKIKPLSWLGKSITLFAEKDAHWAKLANPDVDESELLLGAPLGIRIEHTSKLKLAMFLTALKTTIQSAAPDAVKWKTKEHGESKYVVLTSNELGLEKELKICYAITKSAIIFTMGEDVLKRAIDRELAEHKLALTPVQEQADHFYLNADSRFLMGLSGATGTTMADRRRAQSYRAIPILNEWRKLWIGKDPVTEHLQRFGEDIFCPGGKGYQWNVEEMTMESIAYGHRAKPKKIVDDGSLLNAFGHIESAMKFENDGLRVKLKFTERKAIPANQSSIINPGKESLGNLSHPTKPGLRWEFDTVIKDQDGKEHKVLEWTENVSFNKGILIQKYNGYNLIEGKLVEFIGTRNMLIEGDVKIIYQETEKAENIDPEINARNRVTLNPAPLIYPENLKRGYHLTQQFSIKYSLGGEQGQTVQSIKIIGKEDLTIAGKVYKDCIIVLTEGETIILGSTYTLTHKSWILPKIGIVKSTAKTIASKTTWTLRNFK